MNFKKFLLRIMLVTLVSTGLIIPPHLQAFSQKSGNNQSTDKKQLASISGTITDETGAIIPATKVTAKNLATNEEISVMANENGIYRISDLVVGYYEVKAQAEGFKLTFTKILITSTSTKFDFQLSVASTSEIVEVTSAETRVEKVTSQISTNYDARQVKELPTTSRNSIDLSTLNPNAKTKGKHKQAKTDLSVNGQTARSNKIKINGQDNNDSTINHDRVSNSEGYKNYGVNPWTQTVKDKFSTFAVDVDTGSYTIARRKLTEGTLPPKDSVRVEEFVNYFKYQYPNPSTTHPFSLTMEASSSPFNPINHYLLRIGVKGREVLAKDRSPSHLTFLVDTSGSMQSEDKIGLVKKSLKMLVNHLETKDTVAITTYAGGVTLVLSPTSISNKEIILNAIDNLQSGGATAMASGIDLAYAQAHSSFETNSINRIIICSDGDANIGKTSHEEILKQIEGYVKEGITVTTLGFGDGNYKDEMMEQFANKGNGNYYYIDKLAQARRVFVEQLTGTLQVIAKDVKIQVEFDPSTVVNYRLVGYENRDIADEDFRNDKVDAGEIGAGHMVTAVYELQLTKHPTNNIAVVKLRYKTPDAKTETPAQEVTASYSLTRLKQNFDQSSEDFRFSVAVAAFAEVLRESQAAKNWSLEKIANIAQSSTQPNNQERLEFIDLVKKAQQLKVASAVQVKP